MNRYENIKKCIEVVKNDPLCMTEKDNPEEIADKAYKELEDLVRLLTEYHDKVVELVVANHDLTIGYY